MTWHFRTRRAIRRLIGVGGLASALRSDGSGAPTGGLDERFRKLWRDRIYGLAHVRLVAVVIGALAVGGLWLGASPALAAYTHTFSFSFGSSQLSSPQSVAVNEATGDIYVADQGNDRVDQFDSSGNFIAAWGEDVDATTGGNICTAASGDTCQAGTSSSSPGGFEQPQFVAVDNDPSSGSFGDVYVGDSGDSLVTKFDSNGDVVSSWGDQSPADGQLSGQNASAGAFGGIDGLTVDSDANLWVYADTRSGEVYEFGQDGSVITDFSTFGITEFGVGCNLCTSAAPVGIGVAPNGGVLIGQTIDGPLNTEEFTSAGTYVGWVSGDQTASVTGLAVDPGTGDVYVDDGGSLIRRYAGSSLSTCVPADDCVTADEFGSANLSGSAAMLSYDGATGAVYVADPGSNQVEVFDQVLVPDVTTGTASGVTVTGATLNGTVNPDGMTVTGCEFEYVSAASYERTASDPYSAGQTASCASALPSGSSPSSVSASLSGLTPGTVYHYRLEASNSNGTSYGADQTFSTGPTIDSQAATDASDSGVTLTAQINPQGNDTTYHFEYGTSGPCSSNSCTSVPVPDQDIGSGTSDVAVSQALTGLPAGTGYDWRVVATSSEGTVDGPDEIFTTNSQPGAAPSSSGCPNAALLTGPAAGLPDCRAFEQVTPTDKAGDDLAVFPGSSEAGSGGNAVTFTSDSSFPGAVGSGNGAQLFASTRGSDGWSTAGLIPPDSLGADAKVIGWSPDLAWSVAQAQDASIGGGSVYLHSTTDGSWTPIVSFSATGSANPPFELTGVSPDGSLVAFNWKGPLTSDAPQNRRNDGYVWSASTGEISLTSVLPDGTAATGGPGNSSVGIYSGPYSNAVASDGSAVVFSAAADAGDDNGTNQVFLREDPTASDASTVEASASQKTNGSGPSGTDPNGPQNATFAAASPDASHVLFTSPEELTNNADTGTDDQGNDLYEYSASGGQMVDVSAPNPGVSDSDPNGAEVQGVLGMSDDGSYVYFVANGVLAAGAPAGNCRPDTQGVGNIGSCDLYLSHNGVISYVTQLIAGDGNGGAGSDDTDWQTGPGQTAWVTPDGQTALFESALPLTGYDNMPANPYACADNGGNPVGCSELYRYSSGSGTIQCVSCDPSGAPPLGSVGAAAASQTNDQGAIGGQLALVPTRNLSSSGDQVFFESADPLLSQDGNGQANVYEWEADGAGSCQTSGGCLYSISTGQSSQPDDLIDASASGSDVFFATWQQLVGQDQDDIIDIYDARVDGGISSQNPPPAPAPCVGEGCKPPPSSAPPTPPPTPVSVTFTGPGDSSSSDTASVKVVRRVLLGRSFAVRVTVPVSGRITGSGRDLRGASRTATRAGTYRLTMRLTDRAERLLKHRHRLRLRIRVVFAPTNGGAASAAVSMTVKEKSR